MEQNRQGKIVLTHALFQGDILKKEIRELGFPLLGRDHLHLETRGTLNDTVELNLCLRTAHRVLFHISAFNSASLIDLYSQIKKIAWEEIIPVSGYFSINSYVRQKNISDFRIVNQKAKDAIVDRFYAKFNKRPDSGKENTGVVLFIHWTEDQCQVYVDTSGESLARHGYRKHSWKAPLSEALAAAILYEMKWKPGDTLVNPMCGSGTLAIEAALMATNRFPGLLRDNYAFRHIAGFDGNDYLKKKDDLRKRIRENNHSMIIASDIHKTAISQARLNARLAGVESLIRFESYEFKETTVPVPRGAIILNPEYGSRMGEEEKLEKTYKEIGDFFKQKAGGYMGYVFTGNLQLAKKIGLRTKRRIPFMNGNIECRLLEYEMYEGSKKQ